MSKAQARWFLVLSLPSLWYAVDSTLTHFSLLKQLKRQRVITLCPLSLLQREFSPPVSSLKGLSERSDKCRGKIGSRRTWPEQWKMCNRAKLELPCHHRPAAHCSFFWHFTTSTELLLTPNPLETGNPGSSMAHTAEETGHNYNIPFTFLKLKN